MTVSILVLDEDGVLKSGAESSTALVPESPVTKP